MSLSAHDFSTTGRGPPGRAHGHSTEQHRGPSGLWARVLWLARS